MARRRRTERRVDLRAGAGAWSALRITPMIDVVFLLLLYFMLNARFAPDEFVFRVDVPRPERIGAPDDPFALPERPITVTVRSQGAGPGEYSIVTDSTVLPATGTFDTLSGALRAARGATLGEGQRFLVRPDRGTLWEHSLGAFDSIVRSGFTNVRFAEPTS